VTPNFTLGRCGAENPRRCSITSHALGSGGADALATSSTWGRCCCKFIICTRAQNARSPFLGIGFIVLIGGCIAHVAPAAAAAPCASATTTTAHKNIYHQHSTIPTRCINCALQMQQIKSSTINAVFAPSAVWFAGRINKCTNTVCDH
jgi:hypothetical protein